MSSLISVLAGVTSLALLAAASPSQLVSRAPAAPPTVAKVDSYDFQGCYKDFTGARAISSKNIFTDSLTVERCSEFCKGAVYIGIEYGKECFCADTLAATTVKLADTDCAIGCSGNSAQLCGGHLALTVYKSTNLPNTAGVTPPAFKPVGCYTDVITARTLKGAKYDDLAMNIPKCATACKIGNWKLFGLEFGRECYCGNTLEGTTSVDLVQCGALCPGDKSAICGGLTRLSVYEIVDASGSATTTTTTTTTTKTTSTTTSTTTTTRKA